MRFHAGFRAAAAAALLGVAATTPARACCMVPMRWKGDVDQAEQRVVVLHHDGHEELIVRVAPFFQTKDKQQLPDDVAAAPPYVEWVVTVPSTPTGYATVPKAVFDDASTLADRLDDLAEEQYAHRSRWEWPKLAALVARDATPTTASASLASHGLEIAAPVRVGPYEITAVKARGRAALDELNAYLGKYGFPQEDADHMAWFVDREFTFLCIHITPPPGSATLGKRLDLDALQIGFDTPRPYYPGKFSSQQGPFALALTAITSRPIALDSRAAIGRKLRVSLPRYANLWTEKALPGALADGRKPFPAVERWHVNRLDSFGFNFPGPDGKPAISTWTDDVLFDLGGDGDAMPGWYYGDRDIGTPERLWREHRVAGGLWAALAAAVFLFLRWRARRRTARPGA